MKNSINKYANGFNSISFAKIFRYFILIIANIILAKSYFTTSEIGVYEKFLFFVALSSSFWVNGIIKTFLLDNKEKLKFNYFNYTIAFQALGVVVSLLLFTLNYTSSLINISNFQLYLLLAFIVIQSPTYIIEYIYLNEEKHSHIFIYSILNYSCWIVAISIPILLNASIDYVLLSLFIYSAIKYSWLLNIVNKYSNFKIDINYILSIFQKSIPLLLLTGIGGFGAYIDGLIVSFTQSKEIFAIFSYGAKELPIALILATVIDQVYLAKLSNQSNKSDLFFEIKKQGQKIMHFIFPISIVLLFCSSYLFETVFNSNFRDSAVFFNIYLLIIITRMLSPQTVILAYGKKNALVVIAIIELTLNIMLSLIFYKYWGITGIAYATVLAHFIEKVLLVIYNTLKLKIRIGKYVNINTLLIYSFLLISSYIFNLYYLL